MQQTVQEKIRQRRRQMLVHSYIYYNLDKNIVSDFKWSKWAKELVDLQRDYTEESKQVEFYEDFKDWDGSSGAFLKFPENIKTVAERLLRNSADKTVKNKTKKVKNSKLKRLF